MQLCEPPLIKAIHDSGVAFEDVEEYLHALHAPSRNAAMREINPTEQELKDKTAALEARRYGLQIQTGMAPLDPFSIIFAFMVNFVRTTSMLGTP